MSENPYKNDADQDPDQKRPEVDQADQPMQADPREDTPTADAAEADAQSDPREN